MLLLVLVLELFIAGKSQQKILCYISVCMYVSSMNISGNNFVKKKPVEINNFQSKSNMKRIFSDYAHESGKKRLFFLKKVWT